MPKQELEFTDYLGAIAVWFTFFSIMFVISITVINFCCINKKDDITAIEEWGHKRKLHVRLGVHSPSVIEMHSRNSKKVEQDEE